MMAMNVTVWLLVLICAYGTHAFTVTPIVDKYTSNNESVPDPSFNSSGSLLRYDTKTYYYSSLQLSAIAIALIVLGVMGFFFIVSCIIFLVCRKKTIMPGRIISGPNLNVVPHLNIPSQPIYPYYGTPYVDGRNILPPSGPPATEMHTPPPDYNSISANNPLPKSTK